MIILKCFCAVILIVGLGATIIGAAFSFLSLPSVSEVIDYFIEGLTDFPWLVMICGFAMVAFGCGTLAVLFR